MKIVLIIIILAIGFVYADLPAYKLYDKDGNAVGFEEMSEKLKSADIVLFGELHDNPISHWLELKLTEALFVKKAGGLILGAEMFEADNQLIMDEYLEGLIKTNHFEDNMRLWHNYQTDYKPLVEFAKNNGIRFIAGNIPRRYASIVARSGFQGLNDLSDQAKSFIAPLPVLYDPELNCYKQMLNMGGMPGKMHSDYLPKAQAVKDATMAYFIYNNLRKGMTFLHFNGRYHSDNYESIVWYLNQLDSSLNIMTISTVLNEDLKISNEDKNIADYIIVIPETMTRTYN